MKYLPPQEKYQLYEELSYEEKSKYKLTEKEKLNKTNTEISEAEKQKYVESLNKTESKYFQQVKRIIENAQKNHESEESELLLLLKKNSESEILNYNDPKEKSKLYEKYTENDENDIIKRVNKFLSWHI